MKITLQVQHLKDKSKKMKRVLMTTIKTDTPGMENINSVGEIPDGSPLAKEIDYIVTETLKMHKEKIKQDNKKKLNKKKSVKSKILEKIGKKKKK